MKFSLRICFLFGLLFLYPIHSEINFDEGKNPTVIKVLRSSLLPDKKSIRLDWEPPRGEGEIIIARSNAIIDTPEKLYIADSLGRFKSIGLDGMRNHFDYNLKPGTYFYAIVMVGDVRKREVKLFANQNYTVIPTIIEDEASLPVSSDFPAFPGDASFMPLVGGVSELSATIERNNVRLNWTPPVGATAGRTIYTVYRSNSPLTSLPLMQRAEKLVEVSHPSLTFLDQDLTQSRTIYYGVSVKQVGGEESLPLEDKKSTIRVFYIKQPNKTSAEVILEETPKTQPTTRSEPVREVKPEVDAPGTMHVRGVGYERVGKGAVISWIRAEEADESTIYTIYASTKPLDKGPSSFGAGSVVKVASISHPKTNFFIKELKEIEDLYFGITAKSNSIPEDFNLRENVSFFRYEFDRNLETPEEAPVTLADNETKKQEAKKDTNEHYVSPADQTKMDVTREESRDNKEEKFATVEYDLGQTDLNRIIRETVFNKKYETAVYRIEEYLKRNPNEYLRGKAYFFLGVSYQKIGESKKALKYLLRKETKAYSPARTEFWTNMALNQPNRGNL